MYCWIHNICATFLIFFSLNTWWSWGCPTLISPATLQESAFYLYLSRISFTVYWNHHRTNICQINHNFCLTLWLYLLWSKCQSSTVFHKTSDSHQDWRTHKELKTCSWIQTVWFSKFGTCDFLAACLWALEVAVNWHFVVELAGWGIWLVLGVKDFCVEVLLW